MSRFEHSEEDGWTVGGDVDKVTVAVHVSGDSLDPERVTSLLGVEPTFAARKGDERVSGSGHRTVVQRTGVWWIDVADSREWLLEDAIEALLSRLPPEGPVWDELGKNYTLRLSCALHIEAWNRGCELSPRILAKIAQRGLTLDFDIYYSGEDPSDDA